LGKHVRFAFIAVVIAVAVILVAFVAVNMTSFSGKPADGSLVLQVDDKLKVVGPYYLSTPPFLSNNSYKITKVFLENATLWNGSSNSISGPNVFINLTNPCFVNGTIRNDYTTQEIIELSKDGKSECYIGLDIYLYDNQGNMVNTLNRGNPFRGCYEVSLMNAQEASFTVDFAASTQVASFEIYVSYLDPIPLS
jgi:hypothetical protein